MLVWVKVGQTETWKLVPNADVPSYVCWTFKSTDCTVLVSTETSPVLLEMVTPEPVYAAPAVVYSAKVRVHTEVMEGTVR